MRHDGPPLLRSVAVVFGIILTISCLGTLNLNIGDIDGMSSVPTRFYGMDFKGLNWQIADFSWERESTYDIMRNYGVNMLRRHFSGEPVYNNDSAYMARLERCATLAAARGMWVIFDLYSWGVGSDYNTVRFTAQRQWDKTSPYWTDARWNQLWTNMGNRFKHHPNVIVELMNEPHVYPGSVSGDAMYNATAARCAATITLLRNLGFTNYIGIPPLAFGSTLAPWVTRHTTIAAADPLDKFFFFLHYYYYWHGGGTSESQIRTYLAGKEADTIQDLGYRVCIGEFGVHGAENNQSSTERTWFQNFLKVQRDDGYDTCFQSFQPGSDFPGIQGDLSDSYWPTRTPTTVFRYFYQGFTGYGGIPDGLQYYTDQPYDDSTLTVTAQYTNGASIHAAAEVWTQGAGSSAYVGVSSYPRTDAGAYSTAVIDDIIDTMDAEGLSIYRMSVYYTQPNTVFAAMAQHFLDHCSYDLILCRHIYDPGGTVDSWSNVQAWTLAMAAHFSSYENRLWLESINEVGDADLGVRMNTLVDAVRTAGYNHRIVANKWNQSWASMAAVTDTADRFYTGYHYYFNSWSVSGAETQMQQAINAGLSGHLINTEIGADYNEASAFSESEVLAVNQFMAWCVDGGRDISNCVWQRYNLQNWATYHAYGLTFPIAASRRLVYQSTTPILALALDPGVYALEVTFNATTQSRLTNVYSTIPTMETFTFALPPPPPPTAAFTVQLLSSSGGYTVPGAGVYAVLVTQAFTATAYALTNYAFARWLKDGAEAATTRSIMFNGVDGATYVLQPDFVYDGMSPPDPTPPPPTPSPPDHGAPVVEPVDGPRIPHALPDPALPVTDTTRFTTAIRRLMTAQPPSFAETVTRATHVTVPTLTTILRQLQHLHGGPSAPTVHVAPVTFDIAIFDPKIFSH